MTNPVYIIAEAGVNHNGSIDNALKLVDSAVQAGANAVKFQTFQAQKLVTNNAQKASYQYNANNGAETQYEMLQKLELSIEAHHVIQQHCLKHNIDFLSTPFDEDSLDFLTASMGLSTIKIGSGDMDNAPLLLKAIRKSAHIILSTGMSTIADIRSSLYVMMWGLLHKQKTPSSFAEITQQCPNDFTILRNKVSLLHCVSCYPAPIEALNLRAISVLKKEFGLNVGFSDHTIITQSALSAVAAGATIIEKHLTLDKNMAGPDHKASLNPSEFKQMVAAIREAEIMLGQPKKQLSIGEADMQKIARKTIVACKNIAKGEILTNNNIMCKRAQKQIISPLYYWDMLGKKAHKNYTIDDPIEPNSDA